MVDSRTDQLAGRTRTQLELAELYTMDLAESALEQLELLRKLRNASDHRKASRPGAEVGRRHLEALSDRFRAQRALLKDLRATLRKLRKTLQARGEVPERRTVERLMEPIERDRPRRS
jgi:hypothetical protein